MSEGAAPCVRLDVSSGDREDRRGATPGTTRCNAGATSKIRRYTLAATEPGRNPHEIGTTWLVQRWCNAGASGVPHPPNTPRGLIRPRGETPRSIAPFYENNLRARPGSRNERLHTALRFSACDGENRPVKRLSEMIWRARCKSAWIGWPVWTASSAPRSHAGEHRPSDRRIGIELGGNI